LFFGALTRFLTGVATMWVSGYVLITATASSAVPVSQDSPSSLTRHHVCYTPYKLRILRIEQNLDRDSSVARAALSDSMVPAGCRYP
jgi:hypothetical protein